MSILQVLPSSHFLGGNIDISYSLIQIVFCVLGSTKLSSQSPVQVILQSKLPTDPIEDPNTWAWGLHPDQGVDYKARDSLSLEVCLANPELINTAKCKLPLDLCLSKKEFTPLVGCSGYNFPLSVCISNPVLTTRDECAGADHRSRSNIYYHTLNTKL